MASLCKPQYFLEELVRIHIRMSSTRTSSQRLTITRRSVEQQDKAFTLVAHKVLKLTRNTFLLFELPGDMIVNHIFDHILVIPCVILMKDELVFKSIWVPLLFHGVQIVNLHFHPNFLV